MTDAPERIWLEPCTSPDGLHDWLVWLSDANGGTPYVRADLYADLVEKRDKLYVPRSELDALLSSESKIDKIIHPLTKELSDIAEALGYEATVECDDLWHELPEVSRPFHCQRCNDSGRIPNPVSLVEHATVIFSAAEDVVDTQMVREALNEPMLSVEESKALMEAIHTCTRDADPNHNCYACEMGESDV